MSLGPGSPRVAPVGGHAQRGSATAWDVSQGIEVLERSAGHLAPLGRLLYDRGSEAMWERDTATLPPRLQRRRRAYREFAQTCLAPLAEVLDADPTHFDPRPLLADAGSRGFQSELLPRPFGTMPLPPRSAGPLLHVVLKAEELCCASAGAGLALLAHDLGMAPLVLSGHLPTLRRWAIPLARAARRGEPVLAAFAITEPAAGSDVEDSIGAHTARYATTARKVAGGYVISGQKVFITGGRHADVVCVFAVLEGADGRSGAVDTDWAAFVIDRGRAGFRTGRSEHKLGQRAADATELFFDDVFVPSDHLIGPERSGWALARNVLNYSRLPVAAIALGIARSAAESATAFARSARLGARALVDYQDVQLALADMWLDVIAMRGMVWQAARARRPHQSASAAAKARCGDLAFSVATRAMQLMGDNGSLAGPAERAMRDARLNQIYEGTNQINQLAFIEGLWASEFAPY